MGPPRLTLVTLVSLLAAAPARADEPALVVLFTNDLHSQLAPRRERAADGRVRSAGGVARLATALGRERARHPGRTLVVDAGDFSMGTLFHTRFAEAGYELGHLGRLGYDAVTFGNHDFDFGPGGLAAALGAARARGPLPPLVAANTALPAGADGGVRALRQAFEDASVRPHLILERAGLRVGVFGLMGRDASGDAAPARPVTFSDPVAAAREQVALLRRERVDVVVALSHGGTARPPAVSEDEALARAVPGIDLIVSGHTHRALEAPLRVGGTTIVCAGSYLRHLGVLELGRAPAGGVEPRAHRLVPLGEEVPEDPAVAATVAAEQAEVERGYLGRFGLRWDQVVASFPFEPERLADAAARPGELALGDLVTDAYAWAIRGAEGAGGTPVDVVIHPLGHLRDDFLAGPATVADVFRVLSLGLGPDGAAGYPLVAFFVSGDELRDMLEVEATVAPRKRTARLQVSGARFSYNPHRLPADRVTDVQVGGAPLEPGRRYRVAMNLYVASRLDLMARASWGLLSATPRDAAGAPIADPAAARVDADASRPGVQELKEWVALAGYLGSFPDLDGDRVPDVPARYARPAGRFGPAPSWSPIDLVRRPRGPTRAALAVAAALLAGLALWRLRRRTAR